MSITNCPICEYQLINSFNKNRMDYLTCPNCKLITCGLIPSNIIKTENDNPLDRNNENRFKFKLNSVNLTNYKFLLDFGCGNGEFVDWVNKNTNCKAYGIDKNTNLTIDNFADNFFDHIFLTEVIEHLDYPVDVFSKLFKKLNTNGSIYIESSFTNMMLNPEQSDYINPEIGHSLIHSHDSLDILASKFNAKVKMVNTNVLIMERA